MREIHSVGFFEDRREIVVSHDSTEVRMRLRPSAGAEKLNQQIRRIISLALVNQTRPTAVFWQR